MAHRFGWIKNGKIRFIEGDAIAKIALLKAGSIDLIIADPPYNLGKDYGNNQDKKTVMSIWSFHTIG